MESQAEQATVEGTVTKRPATLGLSVTAAIIAAVLALVALTGGSDPPPAIEDATPRTTAAPTPPTTAAVVASDEQAGPRVVLPDRGAFREALAARLVASCDELVDGPEPVPTGLYEEHGRCVADALLNLDERCRLAADVFYVRPGDEALNAACDIDPDRSDGFRASVRQRMVLDCGIQRDQVDPERIAYHEYDRCLMRIDPELDETCYLAARAQYYQPEEQRLREVCEIGEDVELPRALD